MRSAINHILRSSNSHKSQLHLISSQYQSSCLSTTANLSKESTDNQYSNIQVSQACKYVAHLELNRPSKKNAFSLDSAKEFIQALDELEEDKGTRCVILSGVGTDFTSGVDLKNFLDMHMNMQNISDIARRSKQLHNMIQKFQAPFKRMDTFMKPIISVQHGISFGLGMELAGCSDIRYCSSDTQMSIREVLIGIAADVGSLQKMPALISNKSLLSELIFTGRTFCADEALNWGFVSSVLETKELALEKAIETAKCISSRSPVAIRGSKQNLKFSLDKSFTVGLDYNAIWNMSMLQSEDVEKAVAAILTRDNSVTYDDY